VEVKYDFAGDFSEGVSRVQEGDKWGFISADQQFVQVVYDFAVDFNEGYAAVLIQNKWRFVDRNGVSVSREYDAVRDFSEGMAAVREGTKWTFITASRAGGRYGFGRVTNSGELPTVQDALQILRFLVGLSNAIEDDPDARLAANITNPGMNRPSVQDALQILRFLVKLPSPVLDAAWGR
jgi:hypothetical protein